MLPKGTEAIRNAETCGYVDKFGRRVELEIFELESVCGVTQELDEETEEGDVQ
jgi:hypothetical protein